MKTILFAVASKKDVKHRQTIRSMTLKKEACLSCNRTLLHNFIGFVQCIVWLFPTL